MNKERLVIKNFGPIKSVDLELGRMTILIGEQATGKSTIAKVLAVCRYFSYIADYRSHKEHENQWFYAGLRYWDINDYLKEGSQIQYENSDYSFEFSWRKATEIEKTNSLNSRIYWSETNLKAKSPNFTKLLNELELLEKEPSVKDGWSFPNSWSPNENFFRLNVRKVMDNPFFIPTERGLQSLFSLGRNLDNLSDSLLDQLSQMSKIVKGFNSEMSIKTLDLMYKNENGQGMTKKASETEFHTLHNGASGFQSVIPIELSVYFYSKIDKRRRTFIIEEPEINLFPKAQKKLMEFFVENINTNEHSFLLPTHSPYFLSAINDLLLAYKKGQKNQIEVEKIIKKESWLNSEFLSVYQLKEGEAFDIFDKKTGLIADNIIDEVSDEMNDEFDELLNIR